MMHGRIVVRNTKEIFNTTKGVMMDKTNNPFLNKLDQLIDGVTKHSKIVLMALCATAVLGAGLLGYRWHRNRIEESAHRAFMNALKNFDAPLQGAQRPGMAENALTFKNKEEKWTTVEALFKQAYAEYSTAGLAPMFLAFQAEALIELGKNEEALTLLKTVTNSRMSTEIKDQYRIKVALMHIDSGKQDEIKQGLELLNKIAFETGSVVYDQALYYLGYYYWTQQDFEKAKSYWQQYIVKYSGDANFENQVRFVQNKLDLIAE